LAVKYPVRHSGWNVKKASILHFKALVIISVVARFGDDPVELAKHRHYNCRKSEEEMRSIHEYK
jgi:hypothetical protein